MTAIFPQGDQTARAVLEVAEKHFQRAILSLDGLIDQVCATEPARAKELKGAMADMTRALQTAFDERKKLEKQLETEGGGAAGYAFDFAAARAEIGGKLDRLRAAAGATGLPEQPG